MSSPAQSNLASSPSSTVETGALREAAEPVDAVERELAALVNSLDVDALKRRFAEDELLVLPDFFPAPLLAQMVSETRRLMPRARRSYVPFIRKGGAISHPTIESDAPGLFALQASPSLRRLFERIADGPVLEARLPGDLHASAIYTYTERGDHIRWHYDDCGCEPQAAYSIIVGLVDRSTSVLEAVTFMKPDKGKPAREPVRRLIQVSPGMLLFFCGTNVWHRVTPLGSDEERATFSFVYVREGNHPKGLEKLYLQVVNTLLYFGPLSLLRRNPNR